MSHMVIYRGVDGKPGYHQTDDIHDAINFVEQMRNEEGVEHARIFRLEEVVFEYRPYYRVQLTDGSSEQAAIGENGSAQLAESDGGAAAAQVGSGDEDAEQAGEAIDVDESIESDDDTGEVKADAGGAKKGLFGR